MPDTSTSRLPTETEVGTWRSFLRAYAQVTRHLEVEMRAGEKLSLASCVVVLELAEATGHRMRMTQLAEAALLSRSGVTRVIDRLERAGLVVRQRHDGDRRGVTVELTEGGASRVDDVKGSHLALIMRHFVAVLEPDELALFGTLCERLADTRAHTPALESQNAPSTVPADKVL
ncbi:hypothetical protein ALI144C_19550 [Actinosynnema sp. ALI-1.44]|uniref:MarR family winged helix-turn-helix transcriptional regulator n=1 Tax=Actinosynnema sp. ALI-1.44 TaxID=1933779 RepID=UPI00097BC651|nr:MarR family transcriptional regulator [Actinosynnema sp. ALI-1.44]ONI81515.1 hypothetical protein ALI144C_19550 [Actinosynnema sp. ALI-1.44]